MCNDNHSTSHEPARSNVCMFDSLPNCGLSAFAPSSPILLSASQVKHTHGIPPLHVVRNQNTYVKGQVYACLTACPGVDPAPSLLPHRCNSLFTHPTRSTSNTTCLLKRTHTDLTGPAYACLTGCPDVDRVPLLLPRSCATLLTHHTPNQSHTMHAGWQNKPHNHNTCQTCSTSECLITSPNVEPVPLLRRRRTHCLHTHTSPHSTTCIFFCRYHLGVVCTVPQLGGIMGAADTASRLCVWSHACTVVDGRRCASGLSGVLLDVWSQLVTTCPCCGRAVDVQGTTSARKQRRPWLHNWGSYRACMR